MLNKDKTDKEAVHAAENGMAAMFSSDYGMDAAPGSAVRELAIRPAAVLRSMEEDWRTSLVNSLDMFAVANGAQEGADDLVDAVASIFRVARKGSSASAGTIMVDVDDTPVVYINNGVSLDIDGVALIVPGIFVGHSGQIPADAADGVHHVPIRRYAKGVDEDGAIVYAYCMLVPVTCPSGNGYPAGTAVDVNGPAGHIRDCSVFSAITGGGSVESNQSLAKRILEGLPPGVMSTPLQIKSVFSDKFGVTPDRVAVLGSSDMIDRSKDMVTGLPLPGYVDVCVAPNGDCPTEVITATPLSSGTNAWEVALDGEAAQGIYEITSVSVDGTPVAEYTVDWTAYGYGQHRVTNGTCRFSSYQAVTVTIGSMDDLSGSSVALTVRRQPGVSAMQALVDGSTQRAPGQDTVVYAATPVFLRMSLAVEGGNASNDALVTTLCNYFNSLPVGKGSVSGQDCFDALSPLGVKVVFPITFYAHITTGDVTYDITSVNGVLDYGAITKGRDVVYMSATDVKVVAG